MLSYFSVLSLLAVCRKCKKTFLGLALGCKISWKPRRMFLRILHVHATDANCLLKYSWIFSVLSDGFFVCVCVWATWDVAVSNILLCQRYHAAIPHTFLCRRHQSYTGSVTNAGSGFLQGGEVLLEQQPLLNTWRYTQMVLRTGREGDKARKELHTTGGSRNTYHKWLLMGYMVFTHYTLAMASLLYTDVSLSKIVLNCQQAYCALCAEIWHASYLPASEFFEENSSQIDSADSINS